MYRRFYIDPSSRRSIVLPLSRVKQTNVQKSSMHLSGTHYDIRRSNGSNVRFLEVNQNLDADYGMPFFATLLIIRRVISFHESVSIIS